MAEAGVANIAADTSPMAFTPVTFRASTNIFTPFVMRAAADTTHNL